MAANTTSAFGLLLVPTVGVGLAMARLVGIAAVMPVFSRLGLTGLLRGAVAFGLALPMLPHMLAEIDHHSELGAAQLIVVAIKEGFVGVMLGVIYGIPFWGAQAAGELIDLQRRSPQSSGSDPSGVAESSITGTLFDLTITALFVVGGGFHILAGGVYESYGIWPTFGLFPHFTSEAAGLFLSLLDRVLQIAVGIAGPLVAAMFVAELVLAFISRFAPQLHVFDLSMSFKGLVFTLLLPIYAVFLFDRFLGDIAPLWSTIDVLKRVLN